MPARSLSPDNYCCCAAARGRDELLPRRRHCDVSHADLLRTSRSRAFVQPFSTPSAALSGSVARALHKGKATCLEFPAWDWQSGIPQSHQAKAHAEPVISNSAYTSLQM